MSTADASTGFIDLATFDELEKYMYGGRTAITYFVRETKKATWFTTLPIRLNTEGTKNFGNIIHATITRSADYLLTSWIEITLPEVTFSQSSTGTGLRWTSNLMHNLVSHVRIEANDLEVTSFSSFFLDFWAAFTTPAGKQVGYDRMIGNTSSLINPVAKGDSLPKTKLALPLPFFFTRDSGVSLPTAALPYVTTRISIILRDWKDLLVVDNTNTAAGSNPSRAATSSDVDSTPRIEDLKIWGKYALVSNDERKRMGCGTRDILIEQVQQMNSTSVENTATQTFQIRFSHAIKTLFFGMRNKTTESDRSNYTSTSALPGLVLGTYPTATFDSPAPSSIAPIEYTTLLYENSKRLTQMTDVYHGYVEPWYQPNAVIPIKKGHYMYTYSLDMLSTDPKGSTNYGKLTNVELAVSLYQDARDAMSGTLALPNTFVFPPAWVGQNWWPQYYEFVVLGVSNNIVRISGGAIGFPTL